MPQSDFVTIANLLLNAGGLVVFLTALLTGFVYTKAAVTALIIERDALIDEKDARLAEKDVRITSLQTKLDQITDALNESVNANKRLAEVEEMKLRLGIHHVPTT